VKVKGPSLLLLVEKPWGTVKSFGDLVKRFLIAMHQKQLPIINLTKSGGLSPWKSRTYLTVPIISF